MPELKTVKIMMNKILPKFSIVTPSYQGGRILESAMQSVIDQKYPNLEYIVIDAGSTDWSLFANTNMISRIGLKRLYAWFGVAE